MYTFELLNELMKFDKDIPIRLGVWGHLSGMKVIVEHKKMILDDDTYSDDADIKIKTVGELRILIAQHDDMIVYAVEGGMALIDIMEIVLEKSICVIAA